MEYIIQLDYRVLFLIWFLLIIAILLSIEGNLSSIYFTSTSSLGDTVEGMHIDL